MSFLDHCRFGSVDAARRTFLGVSGLGLSGAAVALLAGRDSLAAATEANANPANDVAILNTALAAELEAIAAYGVGAGSGLLKGAVSAYLGAVPLFKDRELAKAAASILGDEAMHWAVLRQAIGEEPVPAAFVS